MDARRGQRATGDRPPLRHQQHWRAWAKALIGQIQFESGGNPGAYNPNDSDGLPAIGLGQFKAATFAAHNITGGSINDGTAQIYAMIDYVATKYGQNSSGIPNFINQGHGYDDGGLLPPGMTLAINATRKPEVILNPDQTKAVTKLAAAITTNPAKPNFDPGQGAMTKVIPPVSAPSASLVPSPASPPTPPVSVVPTPDAAPQPDQSQLSWTPPAGVGAAPSSLDHNLPALSLGISSAASTLGSLAASAMSAAGAGGGGLGAGAAGAFVQGLFTQGGKIANDVANVGSSFLVGNVTSGTNPNAYGQTLRAPQNVPSTAPGRVQNNTFHGMDIPKVFQELDLRNAQDDAMLGHRPVTA